MVQLSAAFPRNYSWDKMYGHMHEPLTVDSPAAEAGKSHSEYKARSTKQARLMKLNDAHQRDCKSFRATVEKFEADRRRMDQKCSCHNHTACAGALADIQ